MKPIKKALLLHDMCGTGKAALTNMLPVFGAMEIEACPLPTVLLSAHTGGYGLPAILPVPADYIRRCADHYVSQGICFDVIFIGYIGTEEMADAIQYFLACFPGTFVIMDPIMGDHGKFYGNFGPSYLKAVRKLIPEADILLPNLTEACLLAGKDYEDYNSLEKLEHLCRQIGAEPKAAVIVTSISPKEDEKGIVLYQDGKTEVFSKPNAGREFHGSGDVFDAVFTCCYLRGESIVDCIQKAHCFVADCIKESMKYDYEEREGLLIEKVIKKLV